MIHDVIPNRDYDYSIYVECECGKELIHFVYFSEKFDCPEIIALKYYGLDGDARVNQFAFTQNSLRKLSDHLKLSLGEKEYEFRLDDDVSSLCCIKDNLGFYTIKKIHLSLNPIEDWEICLRDYNIKELISELDIMYEKINIEREKNRLAAIQRYEDEKKAAEERRKAFRKNQ